MIMVLYDNQSAIHLFKHSQCHKRTKHVDMRYHFIIEVTENGQVVLENVHIDETVVDMVTLAKFYHGTDKCRQWALNQWESLDD